MTTVAAIGEGLAELTLGEDGRSAAINFGGDAANVCVMAGRLGSSARLLGRVGDDELGRRLLCFWREQGVDVRYIHVDGDAPTGLYINEPDRLGGYRFVYWRRGSAGSRLSEQDLDPSFLEGVGTLVVTGITLAISQSAAATSLRAVELAKERGITVACVLNPRPALGADTGQLARFAASSDIVIGSREDCELVYGSAAFPTNTTEVAVTDGSRGATVAWAGGCAEQHAPRFEARNSAGAGDAFAGAYLASRLKGRAPEVSLRWAVAAASLSVRSDGCARSFPSLDETKTTLGALPQQTRPEAGTH